MAYVHGKQPTTRREGRERGCGCHSYRACDGACSTDVAAVAGGGDRHRIPSFRRSGSPPRGRPPAGRASRRRERRRSMRAPAARRAVPGPAMEWVGGSRRVGAVTGFAGVGRPAPGVGRPWGATSGSPSTMELPPAASGCFLGLRARAGRRGRRRWSVCEVAARGELSCRQTTTSRGDPHTEGFAGPREWIVGVAGPTPVYRRSPLFWGRSWGRVVPCGAQAAVRRTRAREGVDPVTVVLHYGRYQAPGRCRTDVIRLPEGSRILGAGRPRRAGRTRSEAWMGGGGGGPGTEVGSGVFRDLGV